MSFTKCNTITGYNKFVFACGSSRLICCCIFSFIFEMLSFTPVFIEVFLLDSGSSSDSLQTFSRCQGIVLYVFNLFARFLVPSSFFSVSLLLVISSRGNDMQVSTWLKRIDTILLVISIQLETKIKGNFKTHPYY